MSRIEPVRQLQEAFYQDAEADRFYWLTNHPYVLQAERRLLRHIEAWPEACSILEVGCGEGATLKTLQNMGIHPTYVGFDCFPAKVQFCCREHKEGRFLTADARFGFPFHSGCFERVLVRDVLHHLEESERISLLNEALRVLKPKGNLVVIEGNANNFVGMAFALLFKHERCMLETRSHLLEALVGRIARFCRMRVNMEEPSNLFRLILHYRLGFPSLGNSKLIIRLMDGWQSVARKLSPTRRWAYTIITIEKH